MAARPWCIVANKMDMPEAAANLKRCKRKHKGVTILPVCAELGEGIPELKAFLQVKVEEEESRKEAVLSAARGASDATGGISSPTTADGFVY